MATNCDNYGDQLAARAQLDFGCHWSVCMSDALGTGALLQTSDDRLLFIKRAMWTGEEVRRLSLMASQLQYRHFIYFYLNSG